MEDKLSEYLNFEYNLATNISDEKINCIVKEVERYFNIDKKYSLKNPTSNGGDNFIKARKISMYLCFKYVEMMSWEKAKRFNISNALFVHICYDYEQYIKDKPDIQKDIKAITDILKLE